MKMMLIKMMMITPTMILTFKNPMSMGMMLILQTILITMIMGKIMTTSWFMMITFMMMVGGLMIIFMYMSSVASNEKFKMKINLTVLMLMMMIVTEELVNENQINECMNLLSNQEIDKMSMIKLYNEKSMIITMVMVMFLLLTMISISKIVKHHKGPLRQKTYE